MQCICRISRNYRTMKILILAENLSTYLGRQQGVCQKLLQSEWVMAIRVIIIDDVACFWRHRVWCVKTYRRSYRLQLLYVGSLENRLLATSFHVLYNMWSQKNSCASVAVCPWSNLRRKNCYWTSQKYWSTFLRATAVPVSTAESAY